MAKVGVYVCHCGSNIAGVVDVAAVREYAETLPDVVVAREYLFMCSDPGQELIRKDIKDGLVDRVVVAACTPRTHEPIFRKALESAGLNKYFLRWPISAIRIAGFTVMITKGPHVKPNSWLQVPWLNRQGLNLWKTPTSM